MQWPFVFGTHHCDDAKQYSGSDGYHEGVQEPRSWQGPSGERAKYANCCNQ